MKFIATFLFSAFAISTFAASVTLAWNPSASKSVKSYSIYYGGKSGTYTNDVSGITSTNVTINGLTGGTTYYFAATTTDINGIESQPSSVASYTVPNTPATNKPPTLNAIGSVSLNENVGLQTVNLSGIASGATNKSLALSVTATSSNIKVITAPVVNYKSPATNGTLSFTPLPNVVGTATITVTVNDGAANNNLISQSFVVSVGLAGMKIRAMPSKQFALTVTGSVGHIYNILATQDFKTWTVIGTATVGASGSFTFTDPNSASYSRRFYRTQDMQ